MIHLDHIQWDDDKELLDWDMEQFSSIMYDASTLPLNQNIEKTAVFVRKNKDNILIEGACDVIGNASGKGGDLTTSKDAYRYLSQTEVDIIVANLGLAEKVPSALDTNRQSEDV